MTRDTDDTGTLNCTATKSSTTLATASKNCAFRIIGYKDCAQRQRLSNIGLGIGAVLEVISNAPNKPVIVFVRGARLAISRLIASKILVEHENH
jgi:Fe2+ transport system protein FeoA